MIVIKSTMFKMDIYQVDPSKNLKIISVVLNFSNVYHLAIFYTKICMKKKINFLLLLNLFKLVFK